MSVTLKPEAYGLINSPDLPVPCIYFKILKLGQHLSIPFYLTQKGFSVAIRWNDKNWFNKLVPPDDQNASAVCVLYNNVTYRMSLA